MAQTFNCPNCGGANQYAGSTSGYQRCEYCGTEFPVPQGMLTQLKVTKLSAQTRQWIMIFIVVVFVLPMCLSFGGTFIGIAAAILGAIVSVFAPFLGN